MDVGRLCFVRIRVGIEDGFLCSRFQWEFSFTVKI